MQLQQRKAHQVQNHNRLTSQDTDVPNLNDYQIGGEGRQHCRLTICIELVELTNSISIR